jgi:glutathione S-transferase
MSETAAGYELYYWPSIQGRGEFVRLALEEAGAPYVDVARLPESENGGVRALKRFLDGGEAGLLPFAPPFLKVGELVIPQTANILHFLGPRLGLVPGDEGSRLAALALSLTILDLVSEAHDAHHPIASSLYYEDQKPEALRRASGFIKERVPKFLRYFESVLDDNSASQRRHLVGTTLSYVDLSMFQTLSGLTYAFPSAMARVAPDYPLLTALRERVAERPRLADYLASKRRVPFNEHGIFRHYPELDA